MMYMTALLNTTGKEGDFFFSGGVHAETFQYHGTNCNVPDYYFQ